MAEEPKKRTEGPNNRKYPWDEWLNGQPQVLRRGVDYQATNNSFRQMLREAAAARGKRAKSRIVKDDDGDGIWIQAHDDPNRIAKPRRPTYSWDEWLNGQIWLLRRGVDYQIASETFRKTIRGAAKRAGKKVRIRIIEENGGQAVVMQAYDRLSED